MSVFIPPLALAAERWLGYPPQLQKTIGHPVMWMGNLIDWLEKRLNTPKRNARQKRDAGMVALALLVAVSFTLAFVLQQFVRALPLGWVLEIVLAMPFLAQKELARAVRAVADGLRSSLAEGREAVSHIVGRDPQQLDEAGVARAAIETLAENTSDGVVAPLFWLFVFGLPGIVVYKAINTADSMVGHLNERYRDYGWASAKLDDIVNWIPARLTGALITAACFTVSHASPSGAWSTAKRDAGKHASPNAGWPEAAVAGALGFALGGPRSYAGELVDLPVIGGGKRQLIASDILRALDLYRATLNVLLGTSIALALMLSTL
jgi:adenosylcobinamide-phosphate synthase